MGLNHSYADAYNGETEPTTNQRTTTMTRKMLDAHADAYASVNGTVVFVAACLEQHVRNFAHVPGFTAAVAGQLEKWVKSVASPLENAAPAPWSDAAAAGLVGTQGVDRAVVLASALVDSLAYRVAQYQGESVAKLKAISTEGGPGCDDRYNEVSGMWLSTMRYAFGRVASLKKI